MKRKLEAILQFAGDYHNFCHPQQNTQLLDDQELCENELDLIAAAAAIPEFIPPKDAEK